MSAKTSRAFKLLNIHFRTWDRSSTLDFAGVPETATETFLGIRETISLRRKSLLHDLLRWLERLLTLSFLPQLVELRP